MDLRFDFCILLYVKNSDRVRTSIKGLQKSIQKIARFPTLSPPYSHSLGHQKLDSKTSLEVVLSFYYYKLK